GRIFHTGLGGAGHPVVHSRNAPSFVGSNLRMATESRTAVIAAIAGNLAIAVSKLAVAALSGSAAMLSEGIHSVVDTGNGGLILLGMSRSKRPADADHPFGHGHELYFWALIVGVLIFGLGGGMSIYSGVLHVIEPKVIEDA